jgi:hypothetical protein
MRAKAELKAAQQAARAILSRCGAAQSMSQIRRMELPSPGGNAWKSFSLVARRSAT